MIGYGIGDKFCESSSYRRRKTGAIKERRISYYVITSFYVYVCVYLEMKVYVCVFIYCLLVCMCMCSSCLWASYGIDGKLKTTHFSFDSLSNRIVFGLASSLTLVCMSCLSSSPLVITFISELCMCFFLGKFKLILFF